MTLRGAAAIVGIAELPTRRTYPGRSLQGLHAEVVRQALEDAHLRKQDVDGVITEGGDVYPADVIETLGLRPCFATGVSMHGASACTAVSMAVAAIHGGLAQNILIVMANARTGDTAPGGPGAPSMGREFEAPFGPAAGANTNYALLYLRHMYEYGTKAEQMARVAANQRFNTLENPNSVFQGQPITAQDVLKSRYVNYPIHLLECVMPCAGGAAVIITSADRVSAFPNRPVYILGAGVGQGPQSMWLAERMTTSPVSISAPRAFAMSGYGPRDMEFAEFYD